ncbi:hypothetical protein BDQ17DRAFT_1345591 [Cyathus striatus]|nr:hypothetical protein BDQ17DRAFT_1345591 [Cyathus striatus]
MSVSAKNKSKAEQVKLEGNKLYGKKDFQAAYDRFSEAIELDPENAIFYANRSAASFSMKEYLDAGVDAEKAVELDPKYTKAWLRVATIAETFSMWESAEKACKSGLKCLPPEESDMSVNDKTMKNQMEIILANALRRKNGKEDLLPERSQFATLKADSSDLKEMPWLRAMARENELIAQARGMDFSSGFAIVGAYREFREGMQNIMNIKLTEVNGETKVFGTIGALRDLTNGLLRDPRIFHAESNWVEKYNQQIMFEGQYYNGWDNGGIEHVRKEALKRLKIKGWDSVRPALSFTVRGWIMTGFLKCSSGTFPSGMQLYQNAVELLEWGRQHWKDVSTDDRGVIFEKTFIRGVKRLYLSAMMRCIALNEGDGKYTIQDLMDQSRELINDVDKNPCDPYAEMDAATLASFWMYPKSEAHSLLGWGYVELGLAADKGEDRKFNFEQAYDHYVKATNCIPKDDEHCATYLKTALEVLWRNRASAAITLRLCKEIRASISRMKPIWEKAPGWQSRNRDLQQALDFERDVSKGILEGKIMLNDVCVPSDGTWNI